MPMPSRPSATQTQTQVSYQQPSRGIRGNSSLLPQSNASLIDTPPSLPPPPVPSAAGAASASASSSSGAGGSRGGSQDNLNHSSFTDERSPSPTLPILRGRGGAGTGSPQNNAIVSGGAVGLNAFNNNIISQPAQHQYQDRRERNELSDSPPNGPKSWMEW